MAPEMVTVPPINSVIPPFVQDVFESAGGRWEDLPTVPAHGQLKGHYGDLKGMWIWGRLPRLTSWLSAPLGKSLCLSGPWFSLSVE